MSTPATVVLNVSKVGGEEHESTSSAVEFSKGLQKLMLKIKGSFIGEDGHVVDYVALKESDLFREYCARTRALRGVNLRGLERTERIAFFLSILLFSVDGLVSFSESYGVTATLRNRSDQQSTSPNNI